MSYRCEACHKHIRPGISRRTHAVLRPNGDIERELPVCGSCAHLLEEGMPLRLVIRQHRVPLPPKPTVPARPRCKRCDGKRFVTDGDLTIPCPKCGDGKSELPRPKEQPTLAVPYVPVEVVPVIPPKLSVPSLFDEDVTEVRNDDVGLVSKPDDAKPIKAVKCRKR